MEDARLKIAQWGKKLEAAVARERNADRFKDVVGHNEYVHVCGHDHSILEFVLERGWGDYRKNRYTRIVWSERNPADKPFAFVTYEYLERRDSKTGELLNDPEKPKQMFYDDQCFEPVYFAADQIEVILFDRDQVVSQV